MIDLICPCREGDQNPELRYASRTWVKNLTFDRLVIVGYCPSWLEPDLFIPGNDGPTPQSNVYGNVLKACETPGISEVAIVVNDDFFVLDQVGTPEIWYRSTLQEHLSTPRLQRSMRTASWWAMSLHSTLVALQTVGVENPLSYELHVPLVVDTARMAEILHYFENVTPHNPIQWRSAYGNVCGIGGEKHADGKRYGAGPLGEDLYVSTEDRSFKYFRRKIAEMFPAPTRFEKEQQ